MFLLALLLAMTPLPQMSSSVTVQPDLRLFTTMAALNAAGFDVEFASEYHPVRQAVRKYAAEVDKDLLTRLQTFYKTHKGTETDDAQLAKYISLAVNVSDAPKFQPLMKEDLLPPDARSVVAFTALLREFYEKAHIGQHWLELRGEYDRMMAQFAPILRESILRTDTYLHLTLGGTTRSMSIYLELAAPVNTVNLRNTQDSYWVVIGASAAPRLDDIRHAYLHFQLDGVVLRNMPKISGQNELLSLVKSADGVDPIYTSDLREITTESLIRALELRMDHLPAARAKDAVDMYYRIGLLLVPYFYESLATFEKGDLSIREAFADMAHDIQPKAERERFEKTFSNIPLPQKVVARPEVPEPPPAPPPNPTRDLLKSAEAAFNSGDIAAAEAAFQKVISGLDAQNGPAMYGLALIESKKENREAAQQYFEQALRTDSLEPSMRVWSYIYLARMFDLQCERDHAVEYYQQAVRFGDDTRNAQAVARQGIETPYGDSCK
jgi:tetratricopeptide (TPR) repeat protein